jgi:hypothetical protein
LLGSADFIAYIKDNFISAKKPDKELPALKELTHKASTQDIFETVESVFPQDEALARNVKMFLCQKYTGKKLRKIGLHFGIGESSVSQSCRLVAQKIEKDKNLKKKIDRLEKQIFMSRMKTPMSFSFLWLVLMVHMCQVADDHEPGQVYVSLNYCTEHDLL